MDLILVRCKVYFTIDWIFNGRLLKCMESINTRDLNVIQKLCIFALLRMMDKVLRFD